MSEVRCGRWPSAVVLCAAVALSLAYAAVSSRAGRAGGPGVTLEELERRIAAGDARAGTWLAYALGLEAQGDDRRAAAAFREVLALEPYESVAALELGLCLARCGAEAELASYLEEWAIRDPRLAVEVFRRSEVARYLGRDPFREIQERALAQAND